MGYSITDGVSSPRQGGVLEAAYSDEANSNVLLRLTCRFVPTEVMEIPMPSAYHEAGFGGGPDAPSQEK